MKCATGFGMRYLVRAELVPGEAQRDVPCSSSSGCHSVKQENEHLGTLSSMVQQVVWSRSLDK